MKAYLPLYVLTRRHALIVVIYPEYHLAYSLENWTANEKTPQTSLLYMNCPDFEEIMLMCNCDCRYVGHQYVIKRSKYGYAGFVQVFTIIEVINKAYFNNCKRKCTPTVMLCTAIRIIFQIEQFVIFEYFFSGKMQKNKANISIQRVYFASRKQKHGW